MHVRVQGRSFLTIAAGALAAAGFAVAGCGIAVAEQAREGANARAVVELFTSQGCSSCPAADRLLGELAKDPTLIAVTMPVDYWDYLGWKDTLANPKFSARQRAYARNRGDRQVYTPQTVVNGELHALGSSRAEIEQAIAKTVSGGRTMSVAVSASVKDGAIRVRAAGSALADEAEIWICGLQKEVSVEIGRGENRGRTVQYHNVMRRWLKVADWSGKAGEWSVPMENITGEGVDAIAIYLQRGRRDNPGEMLGAAFLPLNK